MTKHVLIVSLRLGWPLIPIAMLSSSCRQPDGQTCLVCVWYAVPI